MSLSNRARPSLGGTALPQNPNLEWISNRLGIERQPQQPGDLTGFVPVTLQECFDCVGQEFIHNIAGRPLARLWVSRM